MERLNNCSSPNSDNRALLQTRRLQPIEVQERKTQKSINDDVIHHYPQKRTDIKYTKKKAYSNSMTECSEEAHLQPRQEYHHCDDSQTFSASTLVSASSSLPVTTIATNAQTRSIVTKIGRNQPTRRQPFDSKPFYMEVKPHITTQKRVRYAHLLEPSNTKALPKDNMMISDGPVVYNHDNINRHREEACTGEGEEEQIERKYYDDNVDDDDGTHECTGVGLNARINVTKTRAIVSKRKQKKKKAPLTINPIFHDASLSTSHK